MWYHRDITAKEELEQLRKDILEHYIAKSAYEDCQKQLEQKDIQIDQLHKIFGIWFKKILVAIWEVRRSNDKKKSRKINYWN